MKSFFLILVLFSITLISCKKDKSNNNPNDVLVYSSQWACSNTQRRLTEYDENNVKYIFKEIWKSSNQEPDSVNYGEMWAKAHSIGVTDITFPLVDVKGTILIDPSADEILKEL